jgi:hypothetical protein
MNRKQVSMCCRALKNGRVLQADELREGRPRALTSSDNMRSALFWGVTQGRVVILYRHLRTDISGQRIGPIFEDQEV